ncbi:MAG: ABC transporter ATP-binding protein [Planctomycetaceae bacterium]|nr:ABC transporter ATP-binding protein [Planctomycetaceae bacterium]
MSGLSGSPQGSQTSPQASRKLSSKKLLRRLLSLALEYRGPCLAVVVMQIVLVILNLSTLGITGLGIDYLTSQVLTTSSPPQWPFGMAPPASWTPLQVITGLSGLILCVATFTAALKYLAAVASSALSQEVLVRIRTDVYSKLQELSFDFYDAGESSSIINRAASDANNVRNFVDGVIIKVLTVMLTLIVYLVYMLKMHVGLTCVCLASTPLLWIGAVVFSKLVQPAYRQASELSDVMIRTLVENLQGIQVVKGFAREGEQAKRFQEANENIRNLKESIFFRISTFQPGMGLLTQINMLVLIGYGGTLVIRGELALGTGMFVFANLLHEFANQISQITNIANTIQTSLASGERVFEVLDEPIRIQTSASAKHLTSVSDSIEFQDVSFGYQPDRLVLHDVSLRIESGECLGITGPTGSGKTTLLGLLKRFYDVQSGSIRLDGVDLRDLNLDDVRRSMGIVFQDSFLFSNTVASNIAFGVPDASLEQISAAAKIAAADDFIDELPNRYESMVGEHGSNLSGGQRQRLALARAIVTNPSVLLLDDATASVDPETEHEIREAMVAAMHDRTTIIVSNRLSTLRKTDRIVVLQHGTISAVGTHDELLDSCEYYQELAALQGYLVDTGNQQEKTERRRVQSELRRIRA